jgi:hypothetical protein
MSNAKPLKLDMTFQQALEMIAVRGKPATAMARKPKAMPKPAKKTQAKKP